MERLISTAIRQVARERRPQTVITDKLDLRGKAQARPIEARRKPVFETLCCKIVGCRVRSVPCQTAMLVCAAVPPVFAARTV